MSHLNVAQAASIAVQQKSQATIKVADVLVFACPLWNLTIPSALKAFLDYSIQSGFTFNYPTKGKKEFLLGDKKVYLLNVRGGFYNKPKMKALDTSINCMQCRITQIFRFTDYRWSDYWSSSTSQENAQTIIAEDLEKVKALADTQSSRPL